MFRKIRLLLLVVSLVVVGSYSGGFGGVIGWFGLAYVLWRAAPAVIRDIRQVWAGLSLTTLLRRRGTRPNSTLG